MALLDELTKVIDKIHSQDSLAEHETSKLSEEIKPLLDGLMEPGESQAETAIDLLSHSSQEINHLLGLIMDKIEISKESSTDSSDSGDDLEKLLDLLFDLLTERDGSDFSALNDVTTPNTSNNLEDHYLEDDSMSESVQESVDVPESEPDSQPGKPLNNSDKLVEAIISSDRSTCARTCDRAIAPTTRRTHHSRTRSRRGGSFFGIFASTDVSEPVIARISNTSCQFPR
jgi:hypothetical protein